MTSKFLFTALVSICGLSSSAVAHVVLETRQATIGSYYKAVFRMSHGCEGAATTAIRVQIPDGVIAAKPMPKPGWSVALQKGAYASSHSHHGHSVSEGVRAVTWTGKLPDEYYDEFIINVSLTDALTPETVLYFPVIQTCGKKVVKWVDVPEPGKPAPPTPAPGLKLLPKP